MSMLRPAATHRRLFASALVASAVAAVVLVASGFPERIAAGAPGAAAATTTTGLVRAHVRIRHRAEAPEPRTDPATGRSGVILFFLIEAARPQPMFAR